MSGSAGSWSSAVFEAPLLRGLDSAARAVLSAAGSLHELEAGTAIFGEHDPGDSLFVVVRGEVELRSTLRGDEAPSVVRVARAGDTFGEESSLGLPRRSTALASEAALVAEVPAALFERGTGRSGADGLWARELRALRRAATRDLLRTAAIGRSLSDDDLDLLLDGARYETRVRGEPVFEVGDPAADAFVIAQGLVQLQTVDDEDRARVQAYVTRGDLFGDADLLEAVRSVGAVTMGETHVVRIPFDVLRSVSDRNPGLLSGVRRMAARRRLAQEVVVGEAACRTTRHVFHDLYRMQIARSLLVIDQDTCVRCGHCAWSCAQVHGTSRLVRRGDKVVTRLRPAADEPRSLMLPNSCQQCRNPACMIDCPTGAIGRDSGGEVFIRDALCTGCGNCAKSCPWENIRIAPRAGNADSVVSLVRHPEVAVKCDACRGYDGPACVQACPTGSILRVDPRRDVSEVAEILGTAEVPGPRRSRRILDPGRLAIGIVGATALGGGLVCLQLHRAGAWTPAAGPGLLAGWIAMFALVGLLAHAVPKRCVSWWMRRRASTVTRRRSGVQAEGASTRARSRVRPFVQAHIGLGFVGLAASVAHAGPRVSGTASGSLYLAWLLLCTLGLWGAAAYRVVPRMLGRIEREGALPEDLPARREALVDRLYRELSGRSELVKSVAQRVLLPYGRSAWGAAWLLASGRSLASEQRRLRAQVDAILRGRGAEKLAGLDPLIRTAVELRALPARRVLHALVRGWLPPHMVLTGIVVVLAGIHVVAMGGRP